MTDGPVWAVVTAFRPDRGLLDALDALREQVDATIIVDDGSGPEADAVLAEAGAGGCLVQRLTENCGIAAALNAGIRAALEGGAASVVTFDQDSIVEPGFIASLLRAHEDARASGLTPGAVVPEFFASVSQVHRRTDAGVLIARHAIQSGMLMTRELLSEVGLMREDLFIDLVDTEFELRCVIAGRETVAAPALVLAHSLGRQYARTLFGRRVRLPLIPDVVTLSSPFRYYYRVRNRIVVNREFFRRQPLWIARDSLIEVLHFANAWWIARPRRALWRLYAAAIADALRGRLGRIRADLVPLTRDITWAAPPVD